MRLILPSILVTLCLLATACGDDASPEPQPEPEAFEVELGVYDYDTDVFYELTNADEVEIVAGFQGLVFIDLALLTDADVPTQLTGVAQVSFPDLGDEYTFEIQDNYVFFEPDGGTRIVRSFRVPFDVPISEIDGQRMNLTLTVGDEDMEGVCEGSFVIRDADECIHGPDGSMVCE